MYVLAVALSILVAGCQKESAAPPHHHIICYAATYSNGIYKSDNGGTSWYPLDVDQNPIHAYYKRLFQSPYDPNALYVTTTGAGIFKLNVQTGALESIHPFRDKNASAVVFPGAASGSEPTGEVLVGMHGGGVFKALAGPGAWQPCNQGLTYHNVNTLFANSKVLYAGTAKDLFKWDERSQQWRSASDGIKNKNILCIGADAEGKTVYAGAGAYLDETSRFEDIPCLYRSSDQGMTWVASDRRLPDRTLIYTIAVNPKEARCIYVGTSDGVYRSTNGGKDWSKMTKGLPKGLKAYDIKMARMADGMVVVYAASSKGVFMSMDGVDHDAIWTDKSYGLASTAITSIIVLQPLT